MLDKISLILVIIGALNWGSIGLFGFDVVAFLGGGQAERDRYLSFLAAGDSKNPLDILRDAGLDMEKPQAVESCMRSFEEALDEMERLMEEA